eukprot:Plantae.Rhodophyta-Hildenbrandia_rubra.ctg11757.p1 GENE.Plantae.Rhodophyta-Hildenbrandia_rubra.ctg11757~~Plantae.Rhodophyta-Hildenbrandia_rubra.ctg11757.p1  ORF type:complete len:317 (-),score=56.73 Plantae.Rhodophyta-Hildenbrandia_rubra.ctg11757:127-1077(-)
MASCFSKTLILAVTATLILLALSPSPASAGCPFGFDQGGKPVARKYTPEKLASLNASIKRMRRLPRKWRNDRCKRRCLTKKCAKIITDNDESEVPDLLRALFHDHQACALDGSLRFELDRPENFDLAGATEKVVSAAYDCGCSIADGFAKCAAQVVRHVGGPRIRMVWGHKDTGAPNPQGNLPPSMFDDGTSGPAVLRQVLRTTRRYSDKIIVLLSSAHNIGHFHVQNAKGEVIQEKPFTTNERRFSNEYFENLKTIHEGGKSPDNTFQMQSDLALIQDPGFLKHVLRYAGNKRLYFRDFKVAMNKMIGDLRKCRK